jgi:hypothetical protein
VPEPGVFGPILARFGPTTPKRATTSLAASVDPTGARSAKVKKNVCVRPPPIEHG